MAESNKRDLWWTVLFGAMLVGLALLVVAAANIWVKGWTDQAGLLVSTAVICILIPAAANALSGGAQADSDSEMMSLLRSINDRLQMSELAKQARNRQQDRDALRQAIRDEIQRKDFEAALVMVEQLSDAFGYVEEAESIREEIDKARESEVEQRVVESIRGLDAHLLKHDWDAATREAGKLLRLYPNSPRTAELSKRVRDAREEYKLDLERRFLEAAGRDDVETAMELLKEIDQYLTEAEAEPFRETARGVIGKKRQNLGVQFKLSVNDKEWTQAVRVGEQIIRDFPNSKMAGEVRSRLDLLRARAAGEQAAHAVEPVAPAENSPT